MLIAQKGGGSGAEGDTNPCIEFADSLLRQQPRRRFDFLVRVQHPC